MAYSWYPSFVMRRLWIILLATLCLSACAQKSPLPPEEVLSRAAKAVPSLLSARFDADMDIDGKIADQEVKGTLTIKGRLQDAGTQLQFVVDGKGNSGDTSLEGSMEWIVLPSQEIYAKIYALTIDPAPVFLAFVQNMIGQWIQVSKGHDLPQSVTPDPRLLRAQSEVITVSKDHGLVSIHGRKAYHYTIAIDQEKLVEFLRSTVQDNEKFDEAAVRSSIASIKATGELWVDAETFFIHQIKWHIEKMNGEKSLWNLNADVKIYDHNAAPPITPPANALPLFDSLPLTPALEENIRESLLKTP